MSKAFSDLLKYIDKLPHTQKERYIEPSSSAGGRLINEMRETRFKDGIECPIVHQNTLFDLENIMVGNGTTVNAVAKLSLTHQIPSCGVKGNDCMFKGYSLRKSAKIVGLLGLCFFYRKAQTANILMGSLKMTRSISCILKKVNGVLLNENHENVLVTDAWRA